MSAAHRAEAERLAGEHAQANIAAIAGALAARDAKIATLRAELDEIRMWIAFGCMPAETYRPGNDAVLKRADAQIGAMRDELATLRARLAAIEAPAPAFKVGDRVTAECSTCQGIGTYQRDLGHGRWSDPYECEACDAYEIEMAHRRRHSLPTPEPK